MAGKDQVGAVVRGASTGRRRRRAADGRPHVVRVTFSTEEMTRVAASAARARMATATYVAEAALDPVRPHPGDDMGEVRELLGELMGVHRQMRGACVNLNQAVAALHSGAAADQLPEIAAYVRRVTTAVDDAITQVVQTFRGRRTGTVPDTPTGVVSTDSNSPAANPVSPVARVTGTGRVGGRR